MSPRTPRRGACRRVPRRSDHGLRGECRPLLRPRRHVAGGRDPDRGRHDPRPARGAGGRRGVGAGSRRTAARRGRRARPHRGLDVGRPARFGPLVRRAPAPRRGRHGARRPAAGAGDAGGEGRGDGQGRQRRRADRRADSRRPARRAELARSPVPGRSGGRARLARSAPPPALGLESIATERFDDGLVWLRYSLR